MAAKACSGLQALKPSGLISSGCSAAWLARLTGGQEVRGSNPRSPTFSVRCRDKSRDGWQAIESKGFRVLAARNPKAHYAAREANPASYAGQTKS